MPEDHGTNHPICGDCWETFNPGNEPTVRLNANAVRCEWCAHYTRTGITMTADSAIVPRHREDPAWLKRAGARAMIEQETEES